MFLRGQLRRILAVAVIPMLFTLEAAGQFAVQSIPTGQRPMGIHAFTPLINRAEIRAVVANFGDNSVSLLRFERGENVAVLTSSQVISGIPSPFSIACGDVIISPSDNSISIL